jgi:signal peptidase
VDTLDAHAPDASAPSVTTIAVPAPDAVEPAAPTATGPLAVVRARVPSALAWICLGIAVVALLAIGIAPRIFDYRTETVLSGSMRPTFAPGDVLVVVSQPVRDIHVGEIISYHIPIGDHHVEAHRIVRIISRGAHPIVITKGDANPTADPWHARLDGNTVWQVRYVIPDLGLVIQFLRGTIVHLLTVVVAPVLLAVMLLRRVWRSGPEPEAGAP